jgi:acyl transferase domain-containing protein
MGCPRRPGCQAQALSPAGRCKTFDASADGYGRGEGCVVTVLERGAPGAAAALAVLAGSAVGQDGRSSSLTAPNGPSQAALVRGVLGRAGGPGR